MTIKCKAVHINKLVIRMAIIGGIIILLLILTLLKDWDSMNIFTASVAILAPMLVYVFYLNRFELVFLGIENDQVHLSFVNNSIFKRKDIKATINEISVEQNDSKLLIFQDKKLQAILRKEAVDSSDWNRVIQIFAKRSI